MNFSLLCQAAARTLPELPFSGTFCAGQPGMEAFTISGGYRDRAEGLPCRSDTRYAIASGTKLFTSLGVAALVQDGVAALDSRVGELHRDFRGWINPDATLEQLLTHTSGCYDYLDEETIEDYENFRVAVPWCDLATPSDYLQLFLGQAAKAAPGTAYSYSNGGYVALGILIETLSGRLYRDYIGERVLAPAGMLASGFFAFDELPANTARGYLDDDLRTNIYKVPVRGGGDGGMYTTAPDLERFWQALTEGRIIGKALLDEWLRPRIQIRPGRWAACGLTVRQDGCLVIVGGDHGVGFDSRYWPDSALAASILSNQSDGEAALRAALYA